MGLYIYLYQSLSICCLSISSSTKLSSATGKRTYCHRSLSDLVVMIRLVFPFAWRAIFMASLYFCSHNWQKPLSPMMILSSSFFCSSSVYVANHALDFFCSTLMPLLVQPSREQTISSTLSSAPSVYSMTYSFYSSGIGVIPTSSAPSCFSSQRLFSSTLD